MADYHNRFAKSNRRI